MIPICHWMPVQEACSQRPDKPPEQDIHGANAMLIQFAAELFDGRTKVLHHIQSAGGGSQEATPGNRVQGILICDLNTIRMDPYWVAHLLEVVHRQAGMTVKLGIIKRLIMPPLSH